MTDHTSNPLSEEQSSATPASSDARDDNSSAATADETTDTPAAETEAELTGDHPASVLIETTDPTADGPKHHLRGMYRSWFLDYASYVILERAVPHIDDGLKPVQRRILHSMRTLDDGRFNKVANIVGNTMQYHPHGDASIYEALVSLGQKELLVETQGNWGNILTGASAAAGRYIEARLSPFALEAVYSPKVTQWTPSYDGRKKEPVTLPVKFPLLLSQGVEGIAVGLSSKILPHNFLELCDAAIAHLNGREFTLYPDFPTGGLIDVSRYNDGARGGAVRIRARIEKIDSKTLAITEIPYGKTTATVIDSILKAFEQGKIKIRRVDDNTASTAHILVHLLPGTSSDRTIDALYAFTDCEVSVSPNCCVIDGDRPHFLGVSDVLRHTTQRTRTLLGQELEIQLSEITEALHAATLEQFFITKRIYKDKAYEEAANRQEAIDHIRTRLEKIIKRPIRPITDDDIASLFDIKMGRILRFNLDTSQQHIANLQSQAETVRGHLAHLTEYTVAWYERLKEKYGHDCRRLTQIRSFDNIQAATVAEQTERLYINRQDGFIGTSLKKDEALFTCSPLDDIIIFWRDGRYKVVRTPDKLSVGQGVIHIGLYRGKADSRTIYNTIYQNGKGGTHYMKRFAVTAVTRDKEYNFTPALPGTRVGWFTANPNGEAETVRVTLKPKTRLKTLQFDVDFSTLAIKGRTALGNIVTKNEIHRLSLKERGTSTLPERRVWFDTDILRLDFDGRGEYLGEFTGDDRILVITKQGQYFTTTYDATNHYPDNILRIMRFAPDAVWTAIVHDADQGFPYLKRFTLAQATAKPQTIVGDNASSALLWLTDAPHPVFTITHGGTDNWRPEITVDAVEFIAVKSPKAKGKRLTTYTLGTITEDDLTPEPTDIEETPDADTDAEPEETTAQEPDLSDDELRDQINGQQRLF